MKYWIATHGCQMNQSDSERIAAVLEKNGYQLAPAKERADLVIFNACSVRQSAIDRVCGQVNSLKEKLTTTDRPSAKKFVLTGCILEKDREKLAKNFDFILDIKDSEDWPRILKPKSRVKNKAAATTDRLKYFKIIPRYQNNFSACVPISTGCNNYCAYCVVPYVRGPEKNRPTEEIIKEVKKLIEKGYREIWLLGQNVNSYQSIDKNSSSEASAKKDQSIDFPDLLKTINDLPGEFWIRFTSSHPKDMSDKLIETVASCSKVCKHIHLPVQAGDNAVLKKMNRRYTVSHYKKLVGKIRKKIANVAISTDVIIGFPGETKKQFENTARLMREVGFDMAYLARYSPRPDTVADKMKDDVSPSEKKYREKFLNDILRRTALKNNRRHIGRVESVLVEAIKNRFALGKTSTYKSIRFPLPAARKNPRQLIGSIVPVKIIGALPWGLQGELVSIVKSP